MREGLLVGAPNYQPGIHSRCFIRVTNISEHIITLGKGKQIAQILFDTLSTEPDIAYSNKPNASFNGEIDEFFGYGQYENEYSKEIKKINKAKEDLESKVQSIYSNVLVFMGIIAAIFTIITINFGASKSGDFTKVDILSLNLSLAFVISFLGGILSLLTAKRKKWYFYLCYFAIVIALFIVNLIIVK